VSESRLCRRSRRSRALLPLLTRCRRRRRPPRVLVEGLNDNLLPVDDALPQPLEHRLVLLDLVELLVHKLLFEILKLLGRVRVVQAQNLLVINLLRNVSVPGARFTNC
jgi:hypothetical protein